jgi:hypothetical protein
MIVTSPGLVWNSVSLDPVVAMPGMALLLCYLNLLLSVGQGLAAVQVALENLAGCCLGAGIAIGMTYAIWAINGESRSNTFTRVRAGPPAPATVGRAGRRAQRSAVQDACALALHRVLMNHDRLVF